jgi:hypothetical protein
LSKVYVTTKGIKVVKTKQGIDLRDQGIRKDCTVRAPFNALPAERGMTYDAIEGMLGSVGRMHNRGAGIDKYHQVYTSLGFRPMATFGRTEGAREDRNWFRNNYSKAVQHVKGMTVGTALQSVLRKGRFIVVIHGHVMAVVDGEVIEQGELMRANRRVQSVYVYDPA